MVARRALAILPTPLQRLSTLESSLGCGPVYLKRDDLTGFAVAGNKARPLEFLLGEAIARDCDVVVVAGGASSNFVAAAAAAARACGLGCDVLVAGQAPPRLPVNLALAARSGAALHFSDADREDLDHLVEQHAKRLRDGGRSPYPIPRGGTTTTGALGFAHAATELAAQLAAHGYDDREEIVVVLPTGSGASLAGLLAGAAARGARWRTYGVSVSRPAEALRAQVLELADQCAALTGTAPPTAHDVRLIDAVGPGFGVVTEQDRTSMLLALHQSGNPRRSHLRREGAHGRCRPADVRGALAAGAVAHGRAARRTAGALLPRAVAMTGRDREPTNGKSDKLADAESPPPAEELVNAGYAWEIADAPLLHDCLNVADLAHAVELTERKVLPGPAARALLDALLELTSLPANALDYDPGHGELYDSRERHLAMRIGSDAGWLRAGRTRREAVRTAFRMTVRRQVLDLIAAGAGLATAMADQSGRHLETLMPDYTYLQQAQPTTFAHYLSSFADPVLRDAARLLAEYGLINASPAGSGAANGSRIVSDRDASAHRLGFDSAVEHTRDAMWQTDPFLHVLTAATSLALTQDKIAEDLEIFASAEFGFVELADAYTRKSILMPQKRNPYALTVIRGSTGVLIGRMTGQAAVAKSPSARSDNLIYIYGELPRALDLALRVTRLSAGVVGTLTVDPERMRAALDTGFTQATDLAEWLMDRFETDYRTAHRIVHRAVHGQPRPGSAPDAEQLARASAEVLGVPWRLDDHELEAMLDPGTLVGSRTVLGGAAPGSVTPMLARIRERAGELGAEVEARRRVIDAAEDAVRIRAGQLAGPTAPAEDDLGGR